MKQETLREDAHLREARQLPEQVYPGKGLQETRYL